MTPYIHVPHVFYPYFCSFSIEHKTCQYHCRSLGAVLDTLVKTSAKTAKQGENLQPDLVWNSRQADKLLNLLTAYLSGYVACRIFVPFSYPFLQLHFHQEQMLNLTFMNAEWSLVTHQHLCTVQSPVSIASLCVAVTSPSSPPTPRDSLGFYLLPCLFPCPLILSLSLIPAQSELFVKTPPQDGWMDTQRGIQLSANTIVLITGVKNANRWEAHAKMFSCQMWGRQNKMWDLIIWTKISHSGSCLTSWPLWRAVTEGPSCIFKLYMGGQVFDKGSLNLWTLTLIQTWPGCHRLADRHKVKADFQNKTRPVLHSLCQHEAPYVLGCVTHRCIFSCRGTTSTQRGILMQARTSNLISSHLFLREPLFHTKPHRMCTSDGAGIMSNMLER